MISFAELGKTPTPESPKIPPGQTLLIGEPIFRQPKEDTSRYKTRLLVPKGQEHWGLKLYESNLTDETIETSLREEYLDIVATLLAHNIPFRFIRAHKDQTDERLLYNLMFGFGVRGVNLDPLISSTCFARDMMVQLERVNLVNPDAKFKTVGIPSRRSYLGEGGALLQVNYKLFVADPGGYDEKKYQNIRWDIRQLPNKFRYALLPHPIGVEIDVEAGTRKEFKSHHVDRAAAFLLGKDRKEYLLVEPDYVKEDLDPWGNYKIFIENECKKLGVELVVIERNENDTPYSLNLVQFYDGTVMMAAGHPSLERLVRQIVGEDRVITTQNPLVYYPVLRRGGWRCMSLFAPEGIAKPNPLFEQLTRHTRK